MLHPTVIIFAAALCINFVSAANIVAIFPVTSPSHHIFNSPLPVALAARGHNVTVLSPWAQKVPVPNLTDIVFEGLYDKSEKQFSGEFMSFVDLSPYQMIRIGFEYFESLCKDAIENPGFKFLMDYPPDFKVDLLITESLGTECLIGILPKLGYPPVVVLHAFTAATWVLEMTGTPYRPSYMPLYPARYSDQMTFLQRLDNMLLTIYSHFCYQYVWLPKAFSVAQECVGPEITLPSDFSSHVKLVLANVHPALDHAWPTAPGFIPIAGIQIKEPKPLPQDLKRFLDDAEDGAIFFSLGSNAKSTLLPEEKRWAIIEALSQIPQRVLWKWESDTLSNLPNNIKTAKWLPQSDILAHPNVRVFISHGGLLSTHEAVYRGVPVIGIPLFADQPLNIKRLEQHGAGVGVDYNSLTKDTLLNAINTVLHNSSFKTNMQQLSARFRDNPESPLDRALFWTEYVMRHRGANHLKPSSVNLNFVQYFLLDVISLLMIIPTVITVLVYLCIHKYQHKSEAANNVKVKVKTN